MISQILSFLSASTKDEGISPLEPNHDFPFLRLPKHQGLNLFLRKGLGLRSLPCVDFLGLGGRILEQRAVRQVVVNNHVRLLQASLALQCKKISSARTAADKIGFTVGATRFTFTLSHDLRPFLPDVGREGESRRHPRSEERRVGKECRSRWSPYH